MHILLIKQYVTLFKLQVNMYIEQHTVTLYMMFIGCTALEVKGSNYQNIKHGYYIQMENGTCGGKITFRQLPSSDNYIYFWEAFDLWRIGSTICEVSAGIIGTTADVI